MTKSTIDQIKAISKRPASVGDEIVDVAPARGPVAAFQPLVRMPDGETGYKYVEHGYRGRDAMRQRDVFDVMRDQMQRQKKPFPLTEGQLSTARYFRAIHERLHSSGYKLSSVEGVSAGGGKGSESYIDTHMRIKQEFDRMVAAIGEEVILGFANAARRGARLNRRDLVFAVCINQMSLSALLTQSGYKNTTRRRAKLMIALGAALDDMARETRY